MSGAASVARRDGDGAVAPVERLQETLLVQPDALLQRAPLVVNVQPNLGGEPAVQRRRHGVVAEVLARCVCVRAHGGGVRTYTSSRERGAFRALPLPPLVALNAERGALLPR